MKELCLADADLKIAEDLSDEKNNCCHIDPVSVSINVFLFIRKFTEHLFKTAGAMAKTFCG